jgi:hypothetical protein
MADFKEGLRETFNVRTLISVLVAFISYTVARLLQTYALGKVSFFAKVPEISDLIVMIIGAGFTRGENQTAVLIGAGLSLLNHLGERFGAAWLKVG